ncbi:hypothetical protein ACQPYK_49005 (plasmid) [Streptosporangium sp. CA-135522]|uniref:hypothetical protein n=1 Tax=Streptosporangium sp. CA-135522 TaxID=3240072 RepID=UPI003D8B6894
MTIPAALSLGSTTQARVYGDLTGNDAMGERGAALLDGRESCDSTLTVFGALLTGRAGRGRARVIVLQGLKEHTVMVRRHRGDRALQLAHRPHAALNEGDVPIDAHLLASDRVALSVARGLLAVTDGTYIWWVTGAPPNRGRPASVDVPHPGSGRGTTHETPGSRTPPGARAGTGRHAELWCVQPVLPNADSSRTAQLHSGIALDLLSLSAGQGRMRTLKEYVDLFSSANLSLHRKSVLPHGEYLLVLQAVRPGEAAPSYVDE